jgi:hypothetical protein
MRLGGGLGKGGVDAFDPVEHLAERLGREEVAVGGGSSALARRALVSVSRNRPVLMRKDGESKLAL